MTTTGYPVTLIERRSSLAYLDAVFACHARGETVLPMDALDADAPAGLVVASRIPCGDGGGWFRETIAVRHDDAPAQISLTSGTTGTPKAVLLKHRALGDVTDRLVGIMALDASIREYVGVPVTYSFGFGRIRAIAAVGGAAYLPERGFRVDEFAAMLGRGEVNALSAVPTLLRVLIDQQARIGSAGDRLRWLEIGSQPMSTEEKQAIRALFPAARIVQHYGLTEASRSTFLDLSGTAALGSVGRPNGAVETRITDDGLIAIRGPHVASGIVTPAGIVPLVDGDGWLVTRDLGHLSGGDLWFDGRADDLINVGGIKISPEVFEERLSERVGTVPAFAVARGRDPLRGEIVVIAHTGDADTAALRAAAAAVAASLGIGEAIALLPVADLPVTATGKVRRAELTARFDGREATPPSAAATPTPPPVQDGRDPVAEVEHVFAEAFGDAARDESASFASLGGDSLAYLNVMIGLESAIPTLPDEWDAMSIAALKALADPGADIAQVFIRTFGEPARDEGASFNSLGGDSLAYLNVMLELEKQLPTLPEDWDSQSIAALALLATEQQAADAPAPTAEKRYIPRNLDTVRGITCVLVIALHIVGVGPTEGLKLPVDSVWHEVMNALDLIRMPVFTALAGYIYGVAPAPREGYGTFMVRKARQLLIPLLFATLAFWVLHGITYGFTESLFWAYFHSYRHLWYLDALLLIFAVVGAIDVWLAPGWRGWAGLIAAIAATSWAYPSIYVLQFNNTVFLLPFFVFGILLYRVPGLLKTRGLLPVSIVVVAAIVVIQQVYGLADADWFETGLPTWLCGAAAAVVMLRLTPKSTWIEKIAPYTYTIYLWHPMANAAVRNQLWKLGITWTIPLFLVGIAVGIFAPIVLHRVALRLPKAFSLPLIGR